MLAHVLDPTRHTAGLSKRAGSFASVENVVKHFLALVTRFGLDGAAAARGGEATPAGDDAACRTVSGIMEYPLADPKSLTMYAAVPERPSHVAAIAMWRMASAYSGSVLPDVARRLLSVPAHAAELERVWSCMGVANSPLSNRMDVSRLKDITQVGFHMREQQRGRWAVRRTYVPGCLLSSAGEDVEGPLEKGADDDIDCDASRSGNDQVGGGDEGGAGGELQCGGRGSPSRKGLGPSAVDSTPPGAVPKNIPIRASKGMTCPDLGEIGFGRGRGFSPVVFPAPYLFEIFALEGFTGLAHLGWLLWPPAFGFGRGLLRVGTPSPSPLDKTNCALDYDSLLGFAVILSSRWGKAGLWVDLQGSSFDGPS